MTAFKNLKNLFNIFSKSPEKKPSNLDTESLDEYEIYSSPASLLTSKLSSSMQRGRHQLQIKLSDKETFIHDFFVHLPPSLISEPLYSWTLAGFNETWRLAINKRGDKIYSTNNTGAGSYTVLDLSNDKGKILKTVHCSYLWNVRGIAVDDNDNVYLSGDHKLQKYNAKDQLVASFGWYEAGSTSYQCNDPNGICCHEKCVYVCDSRNKRVLVLSEDLELICSIDNGSHLDHPEDVEFDSEGNMHVVDSGNLSVVVFNQAGDYMHGVELTKSDTKFPVSIRIIANNYYISDLSKSYISVFSFTGECLHKIMVQSQEEVLEDTDGFTHVDSRTMQRPIGLAVDVDGYIYVSNIDSKEIQVF